MMGITRRKTNAALMLAIFVAVFPLGGARGGVLDPGISDPPPYPVQPAPPGVTSPVAGDPFTKTAAGLAPGEIEITTISSPPSLISGDRARVAIRGLAADDVLAVERDGVDATEAFARAPDGSEAHGLVTGLQIGSNTITATATSLAQATRVARLVVTAHPIAGPVISGAHQVPFVCETEESGMAGADNDAADCWAPTTYRWYYRSAVTQQFSALERPTDPYPKDVGYTLLDGELVPFVVRVESAVVNRSITHIAVLDDPHATGTASFEPLRWNRRLVYMFGESCGRGHHQGILHERVVLGDQIAAANSYNESYAMSAIAGDLPGRLGAGYMVAASSLTTLMTNCNPLLSAETLMMVKEHIINDYGRVHHTIGLGGSGGAIQQHLAANNYPGLIDAATMIVSFPDMTTVSMTMVDCHLLERAFGADLTIAPPAVANPLLGYLPISTTVKASKAWDPVKRRAVTGLATAQVCPDWDSAFYPIVRPTCDELDADGEPYVPPSSGVRCSVQDEQRNIWGVDADGAAHLAYDNTGIQYGLQALRDGVIKPEEFVALNRTIGGIDRDGSETEARSSMDPRVAQIAFATGQLTGRGALDQIPIIDQAVQFLDYAPGLDVHDAQRPWQMRARLDAAFGSHANQAIFSLAPLPSRTIDVAEDWLEALDAYTASHPGVSRAEAVARARPAGTDDQCRVLVAGVPGTCRDGILRAASPRQAAGAPMSEDVLMCALSPVDRGDYPPLTDEQFVQILQTFPGGVCDYSKPSVGAVSRSQTWLSWGSGPPGTTPVQIPWTIARS